jgi:PleD family two-component response regulator
VTEHSFRNTIRDPKPVRHHSTPPIVDIEETQRIFESTSSACDPHPLSDQNSILLAEDNKVNQLIIKTMISKLNYHVDIANNGAEAIEKMKLKKYSLVFMDIEMPELSK